MTRKLIRNTLVSVIVPFIAILFLVVADVPAQVSPREQQLRPDAFGRHYSMNADPLLFLTAVIYRSGGFSPFYRPSIALGDVNSDGMLDIVVGHECTSEGCQSGHFSSVGVLLGNGDGTFQPAKTYDSGGYLVRSVAIADLNGDHKLDLVTANEGAATVGVLLGNGDGTFQPALTYPSGGMFPSFVTDADVNGDGKADLLVVDEFGEVGVLLGRGDGTFQTAAMYSSGGSYLESAAIADVNGDGKLDLLVANYQPSTIAVLLGRGDGTFQTATSYGAGGPPSSVVVADVNLDGKPDLVTSSERSLVPFEMSVLLGNGDGTFQTAVIYGSGGHVVAVADVNLDGKPDLISSSVGVLLGNGDGTFQPEVSYFSGARMPEAVAVADLNGDGRPDIAVANSELCSGNSNCGGTNVGVLINNLGAPSTATTIASSVNPAAVNWPVTYTATVTSESGEPVNGSVMFQEGGWPIATVAVAGKRAVYTTSYAKKGTHSMTATYSGDLNRASASTSSVLTEVINWRHGTQTVVSTSGSPSFLGQPVTFTARVTPADPRYGVIPDGELVTFYDGTIALKSVALAQGTATYMSSRLSAKTHMIKATYVGDVTFVPSTGTVRQIVLKYPTTMALTSDPNPSNYGQPVSFTATVARSGPYPITGNVRFYDGTRALGTSTVSGGLAKLVRSTLAVGTHTITAKYVGDSYNAQCTSSVLNQVVQ